MPRDGALTVNARSVAEPVSTFELREHERFNYEYDFCAGWLHEIRVEQNLSGVRDVYELLAVLVDTG